MTVDGRQVTDYAAPAIAGDGSWRSLGGVAINASLNEGSALGAMELLAAMDERTARNVLIENGFLVPMEMMGLSSLLANVRGDLEDAAHARTNGFGLATTSVSRFESLAAKAAINVADRDMDTQDAMSVIQAVMRAPAISVELTGDAPTQSRSSLLMIAGQALAQGVQGFSFDGVPGKFEVPLTMAQVNDLHREAASAVAEQSARMALAQWSSGSKVSNSHDWVPDSVQRLLHGTVSMPAASAIVHAIEGGGIGKHAGEIGAHAFANLLSARGLDVNAKTIKQQAVDLDLSLVEPERNRGLYVGKVVGLDHRAALIKFNRHSAIELPLAALPHGHNIPAMGDTVRVGFKSGRMSVGVAERAGRDISER